MSARPKYKGLYLACEARKAELLSEIRFVEGILRHIAPVGAVVRAGVYSIRPRGCAKPDLIGGAYKAGEPFRITPERGIELARPVSRGEYELLMLDEWVNSSGGNSSFATYRVGRLCGVNVNGDTVLPSGNEIRAIRPVHCRRLVRPTNGSKI